VPQPVRTGLRYLQFKSDRCSSDQPPKTTAPAKPTASRPLKLPAPDPAQVKQLGDQAKAAGEDCERQVKEAGRSVTRQVSRAQAFGRWCKDTCDKVVNLFNVITDSCRRVRKATDELSNAQHPPKDAQAPAPAASSGYRYTWVNDRGDCLFTDDPKFDPNDGGKPVWRRIEPK